MRDYATKRGGGFGDQDWSGRQPAIGKCGKMGETPHSAGKAVNLSLVRGALSTGIFWLPL